MAGASALPSNRPVAPARASNPPAPPSATRHSASVRSAQAATADSSSHTPMSAHTAHTGRCASEGRPAGPHRCTNTATMSAAGVVACSARKKRCMVGEAVTL